MNQIFSPVTSGNGAWVVHKQLSEQLEGYELKSYSRWYELCPPLMKTVRPSNAPDILHIPADYYFLFKQAAPYSVASFHNYVLDDEMSAYSSALQRLHYRTDLKWLMKKTIQQADVLTAVSHFTADLLKKDLKTNRDVQVIYNGIDEKRFFPALNKPNGERLRVLFAGNLSQRKGVGYLQALAEKTVGQVDIYIASGLANKSYALPEGVTNLGRLPYADMPELYRSMDVLLSLSWREGFGLTIAEAMSSGLPVVAFDNSAIPELVKQGAGGLLCRQGDIDGIAKGLLTLAHEPELMMQWGALNRQRIETHFTQAQMLSAYRALFEGF